MASFLATLLMERSKFGLNELLDPALDKPATVLIWIDLWRAVTLVSDLGLA